MKRSILLAAVCAVFSAVAVAYAATNYDDALVFKGGVTFGTSGTEMTDSYAATLTTNFVGIAANDCKDSAAITVTGAAANDVCAVGPNATAGALDIVFTCYVSASNAVKIHLCNQTGSDITTMASGAYAVRVFDP